MNISKDLFGDAAFKHIKCVCYENKYFADSKDRLFVLTRSLPLPLSQLLVRRIMIYLWFFY